LPYATQPPWFNKLKFKAWRTPVKPLEADQEFLNQLWNTALIITTGMCKVGICITTYTNQIGNSVVELNHMWKLCYFLTYCHSIGLFLNLTCCMWIFYTPHRCLMCPQEVLSSSVEVKSAGLIELVGKSDFDCCCILLTAVSLGKPYLCRKGTIPSQLSYFQRSIKRTTSGIENVTW
jgi:hypothetical protein